MSTRTVHATITEPSGQPREGLLTYFHAPEGHDPVTATADASGVIRPVLETGVTYRVSVENAVIVDGVAFPAGTVIVVEVPEGDDPATAVEVLVDIIDASRPALLDRLAALEQAVADLQFTAGTNAAAISDLDGRVTALEPEPDPEPEPEVQP